MRPLSLPVRGGDSPAPRPRRLTSLLTAAAAIAATAAALAGCGGNDSPASTPTTPTTSAGRPATLGVANESGLGNILVSSQGQTLYLFRKDANGKSACSGACATAWPPLRVTGSPAVGAGLTASKVGELKRSDGTPQLTYARHPLYRFQGDAKPGQAGGQGVNAFGATWFAVTPAGVAASGTATSSTGGSNGY